MNSLPVGSRGTGSKIDKPTATAEAGEVDSPVYLSSDNVDRDDVQYSPFMPFLLSLPHRHRRRSDQHNDQVSGFWGGNYGANHWASHNKKKNEGERERESKNLNCNFDSDLKVKP
jgi:hypothetical protein